VTAPALLLAALLAAEPDATARAAAAAEAAERAAQSAERAAVAAAAAAEAAARAAEKTSQGLALVQTRFTPPEPSKPAVVAAAAPSPWTATVGLGFLALTGNARTVTFNSTAAAERKTAEWIATVKLAGTYGQNTAAGKEEVVAQSAGALARLDRRFGPTYSAYLLGGADADHVKSVELRSTGEAGAAVIWADPGEATGAFLRTDLGFRVAHEQRHQYQPVSAGLADVTLYAPHAGAAFRYRLSKEVLFSQEADVLSGVSDGRVLATSLTRVVTRLSSSLGLGTGFTVSHDSKPAAGKVPTDTSLAVTLEVLL
jgi:putative salt-induced outer membrane protein YdiY